MKTTRHVSAPPATAEQQFTLLSSDDIFLFNEGTHADLHKKLGAHPVTLDGVRGTYFAVWAPNAERVNVIGNFNGWSRDRNPLRSRESAGVWEGFVPGVEPGALYKYFIRSRWHAYSVEKADPYGFQHEVSPRTASVVTMLDYDWHDEAWMSQRAPRQRLDAPIAIYEVHFGSWRRVPEDANRWLSYREMAKPLAEYVTRMGYTHVEFLPLTEHPFYGSWGYQVTGFFAPTSRYGTPQDFKYLVDYLHQQNIGVIMDWVPSHFPNDEHGLGYFDGTYLYEHSDPRQGFHPDWNSLIFNFGRNEVRSFLLSNAMFWLDEYHIDSLRVDAVASMLYLDYSRKAGEWIPNEYGGRENLQAISFLRALNEKCYQRHGDVQTIAEESTSWPMVSRPTHIGGLGFGMKWDMGWMHDTLHYMQRDPIHRKYHQHGLTFRMVYAFHENFVLPLSHDEVVHGKGSLLTKMAGDDWQRFANLRLLYGYMYGQPGKKLMFMGCELGQWREWDHDSSVDWHLLQYASHLGLQRWIQGLNQLYRNEPALHACDCTPSGFEWVDCTDADRSVMAFLRKGHEEDAQVLVVCNFTPTVRFDYRVGVPGPGYWGELLNSDGHEYGGSGVGNMGGAEAAPLEAHGRPWSINLTLPPLAVLFLKCGGRPA